MLCTQFHLWCPTHSLPSLHAPTFVTVQRIEEMWSSVRHGGAGELRGSSQQDSETQAHEPRPLPPCNLRVRTQASGILGLSSSMSSGLHLEMGELTPVLNGLRGSMGRRGGSVSGVSAFSSGHDQGPGMGPVSGAWGGGSLLSGEFASLVSTPPPPLVLSLVPSFAL